MRSRVEAGPLPATIDLPGSKSHANRYLILAARQGDREVVDLPVSDDVTALLQSLRAVGVDAVDVPGGVEFRNRFPECEPAGAAPLWLPVGEGGTTARFLVAMLATGRRRYELGLAGRLPERPWTELVEALRQGGAEVSLVDETLTVQGPLDWARLPTAISAARSTQFASALQLAGAREGFKLVPQSMTGSSAYWELTLAACDLVARQRRVAVPKDWSSASYPLAFAAVTGQTTFLPGLILDPLQADAVFATWLHDRGALDFESGGVRVRGLTERASCRWDLSPCPDLAPAVAFVCAYLEGESRLEGLGALVHKESDRLAELARLLTACGVGVICEQEALVLRGGRVDVPEFLEPAADHRMVMTAALFLAKRGGGELTHALAVDKSFPDYFRTMGFRK